MNVLKFTDYRTFLLAHAQGMKQRRPGWSYGAWARSLGLKTTSSITKVIQGSRQPGPEITERLIRYFEFKPRESQYFRDLVRLSKVQRDPRLSLMLMERMGKEFPDARSRLLDEKTFSLLSNWYCLSLREMVRMDGFVEDPEWMSKTLRISVPRREVSRGIDLLLKTGLLTRDAAGKLQIAEGRVTTTSDIASEAIRQYHEQMLVHAREAIRSVPVEEREISSSVLVFKASKMAEAKEAIREFRTKFCSLFEEEGGDSVHAFQIQFFPVTKTVRKKEGESS